MYTILVTDEHELQTTQRERIMQRSKLVDKLHFLVPPTYEDLDMSATTVCMEYLTPVSHEYKTEILTCSDDLYKEHLEYILPFDTTLTKEAGSLELQLTFTCVTMDADGNVTQYVRKTSPTTINIIPIAAWSDIIPNSALTALDQRILKQDMQIAQMADINMALADAVPDDLVIDENGKVKLAINGKPILDSVGVDVVIPRTPDTDGSNDGLIEIDGVVSGDTNSGCDCGCDHDNYSELDSAVATESAYGNFSEL